MDSWRRIRLTNNNGKSLPELPNIKDVQQSGRLYSVTVDQFDDSVAERLRHCGMQVTAVERLTLEEIFLSTVHHAKANIKKEAVL